MLNSLQVRNVVAATPEELQEDLNKILMELGKRVQDIQFINPLQEGFACSVIYWSQNIPAEITAKIEDLPEDPRAKEGDPVFVCVIHDYQRELVKDALVHMQFECMSRSIDKELNAAAQDEYAALADQYEKLQMRFKNDNEQPEMNENQGYKGPPA